MRICFLSSEYPKVKPQGGIATYVHSTARLLVSAGFSVEVITETSPGEEGSFRDNGVQVHRVASGPFALPAGRLFYPWRLWAYRNLMHHLIRSAWARSAAARFHQLHREHPFDVLEAAECGAESRFCRTGGGLRRFIRLHTPYSMVARLNGMETRPDRMLLEHHEKRETRRADRVSSPTRSLADILHRRWRLASRPAVYPNPYGRDQVPGPGTEPEPGLILFPGRPEKRKGVEILIDALAQVREAGAAFRAVFLGNAWGPDRGGLPYGEFLKQRAAERGLAGSITWAGHRTAPEVEDQMRRAAQVVIPSLWENLPYTAMEAMALGKAVIATAAGGLPEMIEDRVNGFLVPPGESGPLAEKIIFLLKHPEAGTVPGEAARRTVAQRYLPGAAGPEIIRFYAGEGVP
jgi:glycosyltransferase involved in cell wall biosynthesis